MTVYNSHEFNLQTKTFQQQAYDSAVDQAKHLAQNDTDIRVYAASRKICKESFDTFEKNMRATFPSDVYKDLIALTLKSREALFFIDLKEYVITILSGSSSLPKTYPSPTSAKI